MPSAYFVCPGSSETGGGILKIHEFATALRSAGVDARVVLLPGNDRPAWLPPTVADVPAVRAEDFSMDAADLFVVPEVYAWALENVAPGCRRLILNQGAYLTFGDAPLPPRAGSPYTASGVVGVACVSEDSAAYLAHAFPGTPVFRVRLGIDSEVYRPARVKSRSIAYMPRRRVHDLRQVLGIVAGRGGLRDWELVPIDGVPPEDAARMLSKAAIFLSAPFEGGEGFSLPTAEALASACAVVGYTGRGGRELLTESTGYPVEDGDVIAFAKELERVIDRYDGDEVRERQRAGRELIRSGYTPARQAEDIIEVVSMALAEPGPFEGAMAGWRGASRLRLIGSHVKQAVRRGRP